MADNNMNESISALLDGELDQQQMQHAIREMRNQSDCRDRWAQYHLIGDALRNNLPPHLDHAFASRVSQAIAHEDIPRSSKVVRHAVSVKKPFAGFAIAASVAAVAYLGFGMIAIEEPTMVGVPPVASSTLPADSSVIRNNVQTVEGKRWNVAKPAVESKLNAYLYNHRNVVTISGMNTQVLPHSRLVVSEPERRE